MASINLQGDTSGSISISAPSVAGSNTLTLPATTQTLATQNALGVRNRIINGDMRIDQRNAGVSVTVTANTYTLDRWFAISPTVSSKYSVIQSSTAPSNFTNSLLITSLSAYTLGASDRCTIAQIIEGNMLADLGWGTSSAKTITISFQVRSSLTGTFGGAVQNNTVTRSYPFTYTINSANTWETKTITISGDTTGTWETGTSAGIQLHFGIGVGSTYSGTADAWASADYRSASSVTNILGTSGATFYITGVQLEVGDTATPFEHRPYDMELARCQRYYYKRQPTGSVATLQPQLCFGGYSSSTTLAVYYLDFPVPMRIAPTAMEQSGTASDYGVKGTGSTLTLSSVPAWSDTTSFYLGSFTGTVSSGLTAGQSITLRAMSSNTYLAWSAEL